MRPSRRIPLLRGFIGATFATFVALASHVWVGAPMPGILGIVVPWILSLMICTLLAGHRLSAIRLSVAVLLSQLLFHALFVLGSITPRGGFTPHVHGITPMTFEGAPVLLPEDAGMWIAHGCAAVVTAVALHRGERIVRALLSMASAVARWLRRIVISTVPAPRPARRSTRGVLVRVALVRVPHLTALLRRGPPLRLI